MEPKEEDPLEELPENEFDDPLEVGVDEEEPKDEEDPLPEKEVEDGLPIIVWKLDGSKLPDDDPDD